MFIGLGLSVTQPQGGSSTGGGGGGSFSPSLVFSDARNSQYIGQVV